MSFDNPASIFRLIVQTFLLEIRKRFKKKYFSTFFFIQIFFCISRLFLWHPDYLLSIDKKNCSNSKTEGQITLFFKKILFLWKCLWTRGLQLWQPGKKFSFRLNVFWIRVRRSVKDYTYIRNCFSPKTPTDTLIAGFATQAKIFAGSKHSLWIGKNSEFFSVEKFFS